MKIEVKLSFGLRDFTRMDSDNSILELTPGTTVSGLIKALGIPSDLAIVFWVNGRYAEATTELKAGDTVILLPLMEGG